MRLLYRTGYIRKCVICVRPNQSYRTHHQNQDHSQHHRIFGYILPLLFRPNPADKFGHAFLQSVSVPLREGRTAMDAPIMPHRAMLVNRSLCKKNSRDPPSISQPRPKTEKREPRTENREPRTENRELRTEN